MHAKYEVSISYGSNILAKVKVKNRQTGNKSNKRPKGPYIVHLSTMCHLFLKNRPGQPIRLLIGPKKKTNLVKDVEILLPVKFR